MVYMIYWTTCGLYYTATPEEPCWVETHWCHYSVISYSCSPSQTKPHSSAWEERKQLHDPVNYCMTAVESSCMDPILVQWVRNIDIPLGLFLYCTYSRSLLIFFLFLQGSREPYGSPFAQLWICILEASSPHEGILKRNSAEGSG